MNIDLIRTCLLGATLLFIGYFTLKDKQDSKRNWAMFYAVLFVAATLPIVNYLCVQKGYWSFTDQDMTSLLMPIDIYFTWVVAWGVFPSFFLAKKNVAIVALLVLWLDILLMPVLEKYGILHLNTNWLLGEVALLLLVFLPAYLWAYASYHSRHLWLRASLQVIVIVCIFVIGIPYIMYTYGLLNSLSYSMHSILFQLLLIIAFPAIVAVIDLARKGDGTPFPYDHTTQLVTTGVYAYIRNPIQWSFTLIFIPLAIYHSSWHLLLGSFVSLAYTVGVSDVQENPDMKKRFGENWTAYKKHVPKWYFLWKASHIPSGIIYFDMNCNHCSEISKWFSSRNATNLMIKSADNYSGKPLEKVMYIDHTKREYHGITAIANALEHINLFYATVGWFLRFPGLRYLFDAIVYSMDFGRKNDNCEVNS